MSKQNKIEPRKWRKLRPLRDIEREADFIDGYTQGRADALNIFKIKMKELDPEISKMVDENFWDLLA